ncbi:MAG TPA: lamin tail domain-containing protein, partial [Sphingobacterium sp.]|nr:lamin tail domain-containing protein [Sphingobacterium sp.]
GWSLERINPYLPCNIADNWSASVNPKGGTPAKLNSTLNSNKLPFIEITDATTDGNRLILVFNVPIQDLHFAIDDVEVSPHQQKPTSIQASPNENSLYLHFTHDFQENTLYTFHASTVQWCSENIRLEEIDFFRQGKLQPGDILINEVLFNPRDGGVDFVELLNNSTYPIDLRGWHLGSRLISSEMLIMQPQQHIALATDPSILYLHYPTYTDQYIHQMPSLPGYANQQGIVTLFSTDEMMDSLYYNTSMHHSFLKNAKGISLERQSPERPTNEIGNFRSASTIHGGATPGYKNSVQTLPPPKKNYFFLASKTVSPDGDSFEDFLEIRYELADAGYMMHVEIYADDGRRINRLISHQSTGSTGNIRWDCRDENGRLAPPGIYIYSIEIYNEKGHREVKKGGFVITYAGAST